MEAVVRMDSVIVRDKGQSEEWPYSGTGYGAEAGSSAFIKHQREEAMAALLLVRNGKAN